jgi:type IV secretion system protein VirB10
MHQMICRRHRRAWPTWAARCADAPDDLPPAPPSLADLGRAPNATTPSAQDRQVAFLNASVDRRLHRCAR